MADSTLSTQVRKDNRPVGQRRVRYTLRLRSGMLRSLLVVLAIASFVIAAAAQTPTSFGWPPSAGHTTIPLWPAGAPGPSPAKGAEQDTTTSKDHQVAGRAVVRIGNVSQPT